MSKEVNHLGDANLLLARLRFDAIGAWQQEAFVVEICFLALAFWKLQEIDRSMDHKQ